MNKLFYTKMSKSARCQPQSNWLYPMLKQVGSRPPLLSLLLLFSIWTNAVYTQALDQLIQQATTQNLDLNVLENEYKIALEKGAQVSSLPDPEFGLGVFPLPVETRLGPQIFRVGATQMLPWKGLLDSKARLEDKKAESIHQQVDVAALKLAFQVKQAYYELYDLRKSRAILSQNLKILNSLEQLALTKVESGKASAADVLRVQLKIVELQQEIDIMELAEQKPRATLNQLLNRELQTPIAVTDSLSFATIPYAKSSILELLQNKNPLVKMFEQQQRVSQEALRVNDLSGKPTFGLGLDYIMVNARTDASPRNNGRDIIQLRGTVKIPIFREKFEAKEREENLKIEALDDKKEAAVSSFMATIEKAFIDYKTAKMRIELYQQQQTITKAAIRILESTYSSTGNNFDELLNLEKELLEYDLKTVKAIVKSHLAKSTIEQFFN